MPRLRAAGEEFGEEVAVVVFVGGIDRGVAQGGVFEILVVLFDPDEGEVAAALVAGGRAVVLGEDVGVLRRSPP